MVALRQVAAHGLQAGQLFFGLDAFGDGGETHLARERQHQANHFGFAMNQAAIDLDVVGRELAQHRKVRVPGAEVVDGEPDAQRPQCFESWPGGVQFFHDDVFGDLDRQRRCREGCVGQCICNDIDQTWVDQLASRKVDRHGHVRHQQTHHRSSVHCLAHDELAHCAGEASVVDHVHELLGSQRSLGGVRPPDQCLEAQKGVGHDVEDGLVVQFQFVVGQRQAEGAFQFQAPVGAHPHLTVEQRHTSTAGLLGRVHGQVGLLYQFAAGDARRAHGDTDAHRDLVLATVDDDRLPHDVDESLGDAFGLVGVQLVAAHHHELVATQPSDQIAAASRLAQPRGHRAQQLIADSVTQAVVDNLEPIEIAEQHRDRLVHVEGRGQRMEQLLTVGQRGQDVVARLERQSRHQLIALFDVAVDDRECLELAVVAMQAHDDRRRRSTFAVAIEQLQLAAPTATGRDDLDDVVEQQVVVLGRDEVGHAIQRDRVGSEEALSGRVQVVGLRAQRGDADDVGCAVGDGSELFELQPVVELVVDVLNGDRGADQLPIVVCHVCRDDANVAWTEVGVHHSAHPLGWLACADGGAEFVDHVHVVGVDPLQEVVDVRWRSVQLQKLGDERIDQGGAAVQVGGQDADGGVIDGSAQFALASGCLAQARYGIDHHVGDEAGDDRRGHDGEGQQCQRPRTMNVVQCPHHRAQQRDEQRPGTTQPEHQRIQREQNAVPADELDQRTVGRQRDR